MRTADKYPGGSTGRPGAVEGRWTGRANCRGRLYLRARGSTFAQARAAPRKRQRDRARELRPIGSPRSPYVAQSTVPLVAPVSYLASTHVLRGPADHGRFQKGKDPHDQRTI